MSMGAGMAVGMGAGIGAGIGVGVAAGQKQARSRIEEFAHLHGTTLQNAQGKPVEWNEFLDEALGAGDMRRGRALFTTLLLGCLALAGAALLFYLLLQ